MNDAQAAGPTGMAGPDGRPIEGADGRELRLALATDALGIGVFELVDGIPIWENDCMYTIFGRDRAKGPIYPEEFMTEVLHPNDVGPLTQAFEQAIAEARNLTVPCRIRRQSDGAWRWIEFTCSPRAIPEQEPKVVGIVNDVTERYEATDRLLKQRARVEVALRAGRLGAWEWEVGGATAKWSEGLYDMTGLSREGDGIEPIDRFLDLVPPQDQPVIDGSMARVMEDGEFEQIEHRIVRPDGEVRWVQANGLCLRDEAGKVTTVIGVNADITERKLLEIGLREADRRKDEFLAILSHELRNPLAPIATASAVLRHGVPPDQAHRLHAIIDRQVGHLTRLVDDLLEASRVTTGRVVIRPLRMMLGDALQAAVESVQPELARRHQRIEVHSQGEPLPLMADATRVGQIVINLLHNASKFSDDGAVITLEACELPDFVEITVKDTGCGISAQALPTVFELFAQCRDTLARSHGGLGIGLALVKGLVSLHGGEVAAFSDGPGRGASFRVKLPRGVANAQPGGVAGGAPALHEGPGPHACKVLIVDDNQDAADCLADLLRLQRRDVKVAYDGHDALDIALLWRPDIAILDLGMPGMDGWTLAERLREMLPAVCLVAVSGHVEGHDRARAHDSGFTVHLAKPAPLDALSDLIDGVAARLHVAGDAPR